MRRVRVDLNYKGFVQLRNDPGVVNELVRHASRIASSAGQGFGTTEPRLDRRGFKGRASVGIRAETAAAYFRYAKDGALDRATFGGGL